MNYSKINTLIFIVLFLSKSSIAQYESLFDPVQTSWNVKTSQLFGPIRDSLVYTGDTLISSILYRKVAYYRDPSSPLATFLIREDLVLGKAWYRLIDNPLETQIYDLTLNVGDTYTEVTNLGPCQVISKEIINNKTHILFDCYYGNQSDSVQFEMIEGVGTTLGIAFSAVVGPGGIDPVFLCQTKKDTLHFMNNHPIYANNCDLEFLDISILALSKDQLSVYPNPYSEFVTFKFTDLKERINIRFFNLEGKILDDVQIPFGTQLFEWKNNSDQSVLIYEIVGELINHRGKLIKN